MNSSLASRPLPVASSLGTSKSPAKTAFIIGVTGIVISLIGLFWGFSGHGDNPARPVIGYLIGFAFWFSMMIGMMYLITLFYLFDAGWPIVIRRQLEHAVSVVPILAACFVPLLLMILGVFGAENQGLIWKWLHPVQELVGKAPETIAQDPIFMHKEGFLSLPALLVRLACYLAVFWGLSYQYRKNSFAMDRNPDAKYVINCRKLAAAGIFLISFATTFAAFDFFMSLSYQWFSTMYGVWFFATSMRAGLCGTVLICYFMSDKPGRPLYGIYNRAHQYLLGCLCLTFTIFWAYITFCQYFLTYHANVPEETFWYVMRELNADWTTSSWFYVSLGLIFGYFFLPFFCLLNYHLKVSRKLLPLVCCWILCFHILDLYFNILPAKVADPTNKVLGYKIIQFVPSLWDFASLIGIGGLCAWAYFRSQAKAEAIPIHDPRIVESLNYHE